ncbi:MAG: hypothetical protein PHT50_02475 [Candidatus Omnitrophica bacterium]|nr:hypothetical protein [Candidatus Omnitrophota bacterium]
MFFRLKVAWLTGFFLLIMFLSTHPLYSAWWDRNSIPLPWGAEEVFQETRNIAGTEFVLKHYASSQDAKAISDFFRLKLPALDWEEKELLKEMEKIPNLKIPESLKDIMTLNSIFEKDGEILMIDFLPQGAIQDGKTRFTIARGKKGITKKPRSEDDFIPKLSGKPKIDVAPVYPDAALIALSENPGFMQATYFVKDNIDKVKEFYKDKMLDYGWSLAEEKPLKELASGEIDLTGMLHDYPKNDKVQQAIKPASLVVSELNFSNQHGDLCIVVLADSGPKEASVGILKNTTTVMVQYEKAGK